MKLKTITNKLVFLVVMQLIFQQSFAQRLLKQTPLSKQVESSTLIVEGKVISKESVWDSEEKNIYTINTVEVYKVFKGKPAETIEVVTMGGVVGLSAQFVSPSLKLHENDFGVFMLYNNNVSLNEASKSSLNKYLPFGSLQGYYKYNLEDDVAVNPFSKKQGIATSFYNEITNLTKTKFFEVKSQVAKTNKSSLSPLASISFSPTTISAGTASKLTISGTGFGVTQGAVGFSNADDGGATFVNALDSQIVSWSDTEIVVEVPADAGTGRIRVTNNSGASSNSSSILNISYAQLNVIADNASPGINMAYSTQHVDANGSGGYTWNMFTEFNSNTSAKAAFLRAFNNWVCETGINWEVGAITSVDESASDDVNVIRFDNGTELPNDVLGRCVSYWSGCFANLGTTLNWFVVEMDIVFDDTANWNFETTAPANNQFDFESVVLHELGHGHQLGHVIDAVNNGNNADDVMHYSVSNAEYQRVLSADNIEGASNVQTRSTTFSVCNETVMSDLSCPLSLEEQELKTAVKIYPNPASDKLFIANESYLELQKADIYDVSGRKILEFDLRNSDRINTINLRQFSRGIYFVNIHAQFATMTKKIVVE